MPTRLVLSTVWVGSVLFMKPPNNRSKRRDLDTLAEHLINLYPRQIDKQAGIRAAKTMLALYAYEILLEAVTAYANAVKQWPEDKLQYVPKPSSWFYGRRFQDDRKEWLRNVKTTGLVKGFNSKGVGSSVSTASAAGQHDGGIQKGLEGEDTYMELDI